ncbi:MAG TPA: DNA integrity scanning protein DisA nucleotide-binding domain protein [Smithellaceae bacterium]|nr:DNA integrity scanning protein DisA nucleotide-binding domain protein [Smithellaceae bacterium]HQF85330.1 DNA integrity scanning protein DisA nucleotide-binding domain protein [Smithellaceae bacterium]HQG81552.1 DNA integrity scanning protein DisA nucleotide-binding domain protein [Smithellaceae bacterium]
MNMISDAVSAIKNIRIQDVLDIAIIAAMIFALLTWFKTRASRFVLIGILLLGAVYLAARFLQLYLTVIVLQGFFAILLFVLVVIFQDDLRGVFERLAMFGNLGKVSAPVSALDRSADIIAEAAGNLAKKHIGALIVVHGTDPLGRHINGGTALDGQLSPVLLESIFTPNSPGHDGAVVVREDRALMFGVHLPLSADISQYENIGLRHTAALGLSERSDALCVIVSEERGTISVAAGGSLSTVHGPSVLNEIIKKHYARCCPAPKGRPLSSWIRESTKEKAIAILLAFVLWVAVGYQRDTLRRDFMIPVEYKNIPQIWQIEEPRLTEAKVILQGSAQAFRLLHDKSLRLSLDLSSISETNREFSLGREMVNVPSNLTVAEISPVKVRVHATKLIWADLPVRLDTRNRLAPGLVMQKVSLDPSAVRVLIDSRMKAGEISLATEPLDLQGISGNVTTMLRLVPARGVTFPNGEPLQIRVNMSIKKK